MSEAVNREQGAAGEAHRTRGHYRKFLEASVGTLAILLALFHMASIVWPLASGNQYKIIHVGGALTLVLLLSMRDRKPNRIAGLTSAVDGLLLIIGVGASIYFYANYEDIITTVGLQATSTAVAGALLLLVVLEVTRRAWGWVIPIMVVLGLVYALYGPHMPGILHHGGMSEPRLLGYAVTNFQGIYGSFTALSLREVFLFVMLGATLQAAGAVDFFMDVAKTVIGRMRSGPAQAAIVASGAMGSVSGNITSNVASTGAITIPMMKRSGYASEYAGGVESAASTGAQIVPPVMGAAIFVMVANTGIPYSEMILVALAPAILYYLYLCISVQITAKKLGLPKGEKADWRAVGPAFKRNGYILAAFPILLWSIYSGVPIAGAALYTIIAIAFMFLIRSCLAHRFAPVPVAREVGQFLNEALQKGAITGLKLGLVMASLGVVVEMFVVTGFAQRLSFQMVAIAGGSLLILLALVALTCILFGMGMPTTGAYITVSVLAAPALVSFGIPIVVAHFFVLYYALMAAVTPPIGSAAIVATGISQGRYFKTALMATRLALPGFVLPVYFVMHPELLLVETTLLQYLYVAAAALAGLVALTALLDGHLIGKLNIIEFLALGGVAVSVGFPNFAVTTLGFGLMLGVLTWQFLRYRADRDATAQNSKTGTHAIGAM